MRVRRRRSMGVTLLGVIAGLVFMAGLIVHFSTFLPNPTVSMDVVWPLGIAIFIPFGGMVAVLALQRPTPGRSFREVLRRTSEEDNREFDEWAKRIGRTLGAVPVPILLGGIVLAIYAFANFLLFMCLNPEGSPVEDGGRYYVSNHGTYVRELTEDEYHKHQAYEVRGFSGHWMLFSYLPFAYCLFIHDGIREEGRDPP